MTLELLGIVIGLLALLSYYLLGRTIRPFVGAVVIAVVFVLNVAGSLSVLARMKSDDPCQLKALDFDNDSAVHLGTTRWPPSIECRYGYSFQGYVVDESHSAWILYSPVAIAALAIGVAVAERRDLWPKVISN